jgi:hypothetical protein
MAIILIGWRNSLYIHGYLPSNKGAKDFSRVKLMKKGEGMAYAVGWGSKKQEALY